MVFLSAMLWSVLILCGLCAGQQAQPAPAPEPPKPPEASKTQPKRYLEDEEFDEGLKKDRLSVTKILLAGKFEGPDQALFDQYYKRYALARWSLEKNRALLTAFRKELRNNLLQSKSGIVHDHLGNLAFDYMRKLSAGGYLPAARFNAILMIGELNSAEPLRTSDPPKPLAKALPVLVDTAKAPQQLDAVEVAVKVAALAGIIRHAKLGISAAADRNMVVDAMLGSQAEPGPVAAGDPWTRAKAAEALGELRVVGNNGRVPTALAAIVADSGLPFHARCRAAEAIGKLDYQGVTGLDASQLAVPLGRLAVDACKAEAEALAEAEAKAESESEAQPGFQGRPGYPTYPGRQAYPGRQSYPGPQNYPSYRSYPDSQQQLEPPTQVPTVFRRRLKARLYAAWVGFRGVDEQRKGVASLDGAPPLVAELQKPLRAMLDEIEKTKSDEEAAIKEMMEKITPEADKLRDLLARQSG